MTWGPCAKAPVNGTMANQTSATDATSSNSRCHLGLTSLIPPVPGPSSLVSRLFILSACSASAGTHEQQ